MRRFARVGQARGMPRRYSRKPVGRVRRRTPTRTCQAEAQEEMRNAFIVCIRYVKTFRGILMLPAAMTCPLASNASHLAVPCARLTMKSRTPGSMVSPTVVVECPASLRIEMLKSVGRTAAR